MLSYMLPVEEKSPSAAAAAARNLSLNLTTTTTAVSSGAVGSAAAPISGPGSGPSGSSASGATGNVGSVPVTRSIIKPTIKHSANHRYQLIAGGSDARKVPAGAGEPGHNGSRTSPAPPASTAGSGQRRWQDVPDVVDLCDESTNLLAGEPDDDDEDEREAGPARPGSAASLVKSDKNFNNLIVVTNGGKHAKPTNGNHHGPAPKLAGVLKPASGNHGAAKPTGNGAGTYYNGYIAVSGDNDDEHHRLLVSANNLRNTTHEPAEWCHGADDHLTTPAADPTACGTTSGRTNGNCRTMNSLNGNLMVAGETVALPLETTPAEQTGGVDVSLGSDSDSVTGAGGSGSTVAGAGAGGGKKVKLNKLGGNKNVTLKRVSFGSSKGSMVETLVFETPTPLPEHAEREFFQSPAVLAGAGHTTVYSGGSGQIGTGAGSLVHHHYPTGTLSGTHHPHHHHAPQPHHQYHPQYSGGYHPLDGSTGSGHHDDSGIELQEEVERSKVRVSFFQSSKPQSISPPESLHLYGAQSLIHFGGGGGNGGGGYENNNSPLDTYITSAALNQQYDSLSSHQQPHGLFHPDHRDPNMAAVYGGANVAPSAFNRQMR